MKYYKRINAQGAITTVEAYSHNLPVQGAIEITKSEFDSFIKSLPVVEPIPQRDLVKEFDNLKSELKAKGVIA